MTATEVLRRQKEWFDNFEKKFKNLDFRIEFMVKAAASGDKNAMAAVIEFVRKGLNK